MLPPPPSPAPASPLRPRAAVIDAAVRGTKLGQTAADEQLPCRRKQHWQKCTFLTVCCQPLSGRGRCDSTIIFFILSIQFKSTKGWSDTVVLAAWHYKTQGESHPKTESYASELEKATHIMAPPAIVLSGTILCANERRFRIVYGSFPLTLLLSPFGLNFTVTRKTAAPFVSYSVRLIWIKHQVIQHPLKNPWYANSGFSPSAILPLAEICGVKSFSVWLSALAHSPPPLSHASPLFRAITL
jgi:hypothetical protein